MKVLWESYLGGSDSLGVVGQETVLALDRLGLDLYPLAWNTIPFYRRMRYDVWKGQPGYRTDHYQWDDAAWAQLPPRLAELAQRTENLTLREEREALAIYFGHHQHCTEVRFRAAAVRAAYIYVDETSIPIGAVRMLDALCDAIFCPSHSCRRALRDSGVQRSIHVWPHGVNPVKFPRVDRPADREPFTFLFLGVAQPRKGLSELLQAFQRAFPSHQRDVRLHVKSADWGALEEFRRECSDDRVLWDHRNLMGESLLDVYRQADCFVVASRAEAFCLPALEAMATGLPVIYHNWGGVTDFCSPATGYPVRTEEHATTVPDLYRRAYLAPPQWGVVDVEHLAATLRHVFEHREEAREKGRQGARVAHSQWTWEAGCRAVLPVLEALSIAATSTAGPAPALPPARGALR